MSEQPVVDVVVWTVPREITIAGETFRITPIAPPAVLVNMLNAIRLNEAGDRVYPMANMLQFLGDVIVAEIPKLDEAGAATGEWEPVDDWQRWWGLTRDPKRVIDAKAVGPLVKWLSEEIYLPGFPTS